MNKKISGEAFAVVSETAPAEKPLGTECTLGRAVQERIPVNGLFAGIRRNGIYPGAAWRIAVPVGLNVADVAEPAGVVNLLGLRVDDGRDALAADLHDAVGFLRGFDHGESVFHGVR